MNSEFTPEELAKMLLDDMEANDYDGYMEMVYDLLVTQQDKVMEYDGCEEEEKQNNIQSLIDYFDKKEEYEKCLTEMHSRPSQVDHPKSHQLEHS